LRWQPPGSAVHDDPAETILLSKHGCTVICHHRFKIGHEVFVMRPEQGKAARARVIYREIRGGSENVRMALEFVGSDNFWEIEFPPAPIFLDQKDRA